MTAGARPRGAAWLLLATLLAQACAGSERGGDATVPIGAVATEVAAEIVAAGIGVVERMADPAPDATLAVTRHQLEAMAEEVEAGSGILGADLDAVTPAAEGAPPFSYWLGAWIHDRPTPRAELVAGWYPDDADWSRAPSTTFPRAALLLFAVDVAEDAEANLPPLAPDDRFVVDPVAAGGVGAALARPAPAVVDLVSGPVLAQAGDACTVVSSFFTVQLTDLFNQLRLRPDFAGGGVLGFVGGLLATLWNTVVDLVEAGAEVVRGLVRNLSEPILRAIGQAIAIAGIVSHISTLVRGWHVEVVANPAGNSMSDRPGQFAVGPRSGHRPWQPDLEQCAQAFGVRLPRLLEPGSPVDWRIVQNGGLFCDRRMVREVGRDRRIPESGAAALRYVTERDLDEGRPSVGLVTVEAVASRDELARVLTIARDQVNRLIGSIVASALPVPALAQPVQAELQRLLGPVLDEADRAIREGARSVLEMRASNTIEVRHLCEERDEPAPIDPPGDEPPVDPVHTDCPFAPLADVRRITGVGNLQLIGYVRGSPTMAGCTFDPGGATHYYFVQAIVGPEAYPAASQPWGDTIEDDSTFVDHPLSTRRGTARLLVWTGHVDGPININGFAIEQDRLAFVAAYRLGAGGYAGLLDLVLARLAEGHGP